jgi:hypothetical protein
VLVVSNDFGFDLLRTEQHLFEIDHYMAGPFLAQDWDFPNELAAAIAAPHDEPYSPVSDLDSLVQVSWRLADAWACRVFTQKGMDLGTTPGVHPEVAGGVVWRVAQGRKRGNRPSPCGNAAGKRRLSPDDFHQRTS